MKPEDIRKNLNKPVKYKNPRLYMDGTFIFKAGIFRKSEKGFFYQAELADTHNCNSVIICNLEDITEVNLNERK